MTKYNNMTSKSSQNPWNTLIFKQKYFKQTIALHFKELLPKKCKIWTTNWIYGKHRMFSLKVYPRPENFTKLLVAMVVTFCMSGGGVRIVPPPHKTIIFSTLKARNSWTVYISAVSYIRKEKYRPATTITTTVYVILPCCWHYQQKGCEKFWGFKLVVQRGRSKLFLSYL